MRTCSSPTFVSARRCPTIAATTIQAKLRGFLCHRTPLLQATTMGGNVIATPSYGDVLLSGIAQPTTVYYEPTNRDKIPILTGTHQPVAPSKRSRHRCRRQGRPPSMGGGQNRPPKHRIPALRLPSYLRTSTTRRQLIHSCLRRNVVVTVVGTGLVIRTWLPLLFGI